MRLRRSLETQHYIVHRLVLFSELFRCCYLSVYFNHSLLFCIHTAVSEFSVLILEINT